MNRRYKLIKTFPGSAPLGTIINLKNVAFGITHNYTDYPEFWQLIEEKEYEILDTQIYPNLIIRKVKRLSDGVEFKIGDKVHNPKCSSQRFTIEEFYLDCNEEHLLCGPGHINITKIEHYKESLFLDELGNEVFEGDSYYFVDRLFRPICNTAEKGKFHGESKEDFTYFKYEKDAKQYIEDNKLRYSKKEILDAVRSSRFCSIPNIGNVLYEDRLEKELGL